MFAGFLHIPPPAGANVAYNIKRKHKIN
jgi:hypothetical protein